MREGGRKKGVQEGKKDGREERRVEGEGMNERKEARVKRVKKEKAEKLMTDEIKVRVEDEDSVRFYVLHRNLWKTLQPVLRYKQQPTHILEKHLYMDLFI